jgi:hypothetical protein
LAIPKNCSCGSTKVVLDSGDLRCDECDMILADDVMMVNGQLAPGKNFIDWTKSNM